MNTSLTIATVAVALLVVSGCEVRERSDRNTSTRASNENTMVVELPAARAAGGRQSFSCRPLMESDLTASYDKTLTKGLEGKVYAGVNAVSVEFRGPKTLVFLSQAGFSSGTAVGPAFEILQNTREELAATYFDGSSVNTFVLDKTNGLAIWSKVRATFPGYNAPTGTQTYLACQ